MNTRNTHNQATERPRGRPTDAGSEDLKKRLLDEAEALFSERGFSAVSVRAIADAASVNPALVHYYFGSKRDLLLAVMDRTFAPMADALASMKKAEDVSPGRIVSLLMNMAAEHPDIPRLVVREIMLTPGPIQQHFIEHYAPRLGGALPGLLAREQANGRLAAGFDPAIAALLVMSLSFFPFVARDVAKAALGVDFDTDGLRRMQEQVGLVLSGGMTR